MNSRERTFLALDHKIGDRIPIDFWATSSVAQELESRLDKPYKEVLDGFDVDLRYIEGPPYIGPPLKDGTDIWGVERSTVTVGTSKQSETYADVKKSPLSDATSPEDIDAYEHWPDPDMFDYSVIEQQCEAILEDERVVVFMGDRLNRIAQLKPAMYLRGTSQIFLDLGINPELATAIFSRIRTFYLAYLENILHAARGKIDIVLTGDDFGAQKTLLISPDMWRFFFKSGFTDYIDLIKRYNTISMHHTCGCVVDIIPDMIDSGLQILQSIQPETKGMKLSDLKRVFGKNLCFQGGVSIQKTMPFGSEDEIRNEVKALAEIAKRDGGYIFCTSHNIQADTPVDSVITLLNAYLEYGRV